MRYPQEITVTNEQLNPYHRCSSTSGSSWKNMRRRWQVNWSVSFDCSMVTRPLSHVKGKNSSREQGNRNYYSNNKSNRLMCVKGGSRSRFTENNLQNYASRLLWQSRFTKKKIAISHFTGKKRADHESRKYPLPPSSKFRNKINELLFGVLQWQTEVKIYREWIWCRMLITCSFSYCLYFLYLFVILF